MKLPLYLDYMATTPVDPRVAEKMCAVINSDELYGNPHSMTHPYGMKSRALIAKARKEVADLIHAKPEEIIWTSGATEANNLAIFGAARFYQRKGKHIVSCVTEHKAVLNPCKQLENEGFEVTWLKPQSNGLIDFSDFKAALREDTILVSIMHVNNEIGVIQDIAAMAQLTRQRGIIFHTDAAQSAGKIPIDLSAMPVDLMSFSSHKIYGPKGCGALFIRQEPRVRLQPLIYGGEQERGIRPGTLATHQIVGMGEAFRIAKEEFQEESRRILMFRQRLLKGLQEMQGIMVNGDLQQRVSGNLNVSVEGVEGESLLLGLRDLAISSSSACTSGSIHPSYVLLALGLTNELAHSSLRISIGRFTTVEEIDFAITTIMHEIKRLRAIAPRT